MSNIILINQKRCRISDVYTELVFRSDLKEVTFEIEQIDKEAGVASLPCIQRLPLHWFLNPVGSLYWGDNCYSIPKN